MHIKSISVALGSLLLTSGLLSVSPAFSESRATKKGTELEQQSQQLENKAQQQESEGHALRAGRDAKRAARKAARGERKLKKGGTVNEQPSGTPVQ